MGRQAQLRGRHGITLTGSTLGDRVGRACGWLTPLYDLLLCAVRRIGRTCTRFVAATCGTIWLKLLKFGSLVGVSVRRIKIAIASTCAWDEVTERAQARLADATA